MPKSIYIALRFYLTHGYKCNLKKPMSFSEKIIYRKLNTDPHLYSKFVDKFTVRQYVKDTIGDNYLIPLLGQYNSIKESDFDGLPAQFVIKTSNGGGGENVKVIFDKTSCSLNKLCNDFNGYLKVKIGSKIDEPFYDIEPPCVLVEKLIVDENGRVPSDFKIHVFKGDDKEKVLIQVDGDRFGNHKRSLFDEVLQKLDFDIQPKYESIDEDFVFPGNMPEMIALAKKLAQPFRYVRVDMYSVANAVYFGELTFCHGSGWEKLSTKEADCLLGSYWKEYN